MNNRVIALRDDIIICKDIPAYIYSKKSRKIMFMDKIVIEALEYATENNLNEESFYKIFEDESDKAHVLSIINKLCEYEILVNENRKDRKDLELLSIMLTNRCNLYCIHCCYSCDSDNNSFLDVGQLFEFLVLMESQYNIKQIVLSGGEPMLHPDFFEISEKIKRRFLSSIITLSTNGTLINSQNAEFIASNFDKIDISLDGYDDESTSRIRGRGVFNKVVKAVELLQDRDFFNISLSMTIGENTIAEIDKFDLLNEKLMTKPLLRKFSAIGRGIENRTLFEGSQSFFSVKNELLSIMSCSGGKDQFIISSDGEVFPCPSLYNREYYIGDIKDPKIISKLLSYKGGYNIFENILQKTHGCSKCKYNIFCWNCPNDVNLMTQAQISSICLNNKIRIKERLLSEYEKSVF